MLACARGGERVGRAALAAQLEGIAREVANEADGDGGSQCSRGARGVELPLPVRPGRRRADSRAGFVAAARAFFGVMFLPNSRQLHRALITSRKKLGSGRGAQLAELALLQETSTAIDAATDELGFRLQPANVLPMAEISATSSGTIP